MSNYSIVCRHTGEILRDFPFPHLRDQYIHEHKLHDIAWLCGVTEIRLPWDMCDELEQQYHFMEARQTYYNRAKTKALIAETEVFIAESKDFIAKTRDSLARMRNQKANDCKKEVK